MKKNLLILFFTATIIFIADLASKEWALNFLIELGSYQVIPGFFNLTLAYNKGVAFGMFSQLPDWLRIIALASTGVLAFAVLIWIFIRYAKQSRLISLAVGMVLGGALGNLLDRFRYGAVIDFLDFYLADWHWPAFNIADCGICIGVFLLIFLCKD